MQYGALNRVRDGQGDEGLLPLAQRAVGENGAVVVDELGPRAPAGSFPCR